MGGVGLEGWKHFEKFMTNTYDVTVHMSSCFKVAQKAKYLMKLPNVFLFSPTACNFIFDFDR